MSKSKICLYVGLVVLSVFIVMVFYPQVYYFKNLYQFKQYKVYFRSDNTLSQKDKNELKLTLNKTNNLINKSALFDSDLFFKIFLKTDCKSILNLAYQFNEKAYAQTIPLFHNIFVSHVNLQTNEAFIPSGHHRPLSAILAHEAVHVLYEMHYGWLKVKLENWLDKNERSNYGFMWKEEGYAEYIAGGSGIGMKEGLKILKGNPNPSYNPIEVEYFKCWLIVKYLIEKKHLTLDQIVYTKMDFNVVLRKSVDSF